MTILFVVESPNKAKSIRQYFPDFKVVATVGHFRDLPVDRIGVEPPKHEPEYVTMEGKADVEKNLRAAANKATVIYLATDPDREGEAIAAHVANLLGQKHKAKIHRVTYVEVNKKSIEYAIKQKRQIDWALVRAQEARRVIDRYVGYIVSPVLTNKFKEHVSAIHFLSAGRVQTIALKLIVERQRAISNFKPVEHYGVTAHCLKDGIDYKAQWAANGINDASSVSTEDGEKKQGSGLVTDRALAEAVNARTDKLTVFQVQKKAVAIAPPKPLTTSSFVRLMSGKLRLTTKASMDAAQKLFEQGLITYHRTDSPVMSNDAQEAVRAFAGRQGLPVPEAARTVKAKQGSQEGHECLRVTDITNTRPELVDQSLMKVYQLVWLTTLQSQLENAIDDRTTVILKNATEDVFIAKGSVEKELGWRASLKLSNNDSTETENKMGGEEKIVKLPPLAQGESAIVESTTLEIKKTKPPSVFSEKTFVEKLDKLNIGRPSTYAQVIERIYEQGYIERDKKLNLTSTVLGECIIDVLDDRYAFLDYEYTAELESLFDQIADRNDSMSYHPVVDAVHTSLEYDCSNLESLKLAPAVSERISTVKPISKSKTKSKSRGGKKVGTVVSINSAKSNKSVARASFIEGSQCTSCKGGTLDIKTFKGGENAGKEFVGCSDFPTCRHFQWLQ